MLCANEVTIVGQPSSLLGGLYDSRANYCDLEKMAGPVDLGLALTLESHVQINKLFVDEVTRDMDSPSDAKFQYSIPRIKKELLSMEQVSI